MSSSTLVISLVHQIVSVPVPGIALIVGSFDTRFAYKLCSAPDHNKTYSSRHDISVIPAFAIRFRRRQLQVPGGDRHRWVRLLGITQPASDLCNSAICIAKPDLPGSAFRRLRTSVDSGSIGAIQYHRGAISRLPPCALIRVRLTRRCFLLPVQHLNQCAVQALLFSGITR